MTQIKDTKSAPNFPSVNKLLDRIKKESEAITTAVRTIPKPNNENWREVLDVLKVQHTQIYKQPPTCIEIKGMVDDSRFGSFGNFSAIIGKAKSGKTYFMSFLMAAAITEEDYIEDKIKVRLPSTKNRVILFDTEQSQYDVSWVASRINKLAQVTNPQNFEPYCLRPLEPKDRLLLIEKAIYEREDIGIVIIDGIRDLIHDINSAEEATMITSKLLKWTEERGIHIIVVLHQNKGDNNARGHLGSEIVNKAETVVSVEVEADSDMRVVKSEYSRGKKFEPFAFAIDADGRPFIDENWVGKTVASGRKRIKSPEEVDADTHKNLVKELFKVQKEYMYKELTTAMKVLFERYDMKMGANKVVEYYAYYQKMGYIKPEKREGKSHMVYVLALPL